MEGPADGSSLSVVQSAYFHIFFFFLFFLRGDRIFGVLCSALSSELWLVKLVNGLYL